ncbi:unnamed protein product [Clonostachys rhizophaga]|uniref:HNH nuclease domain-containing protein n=1 Tax=Clonostachys rhizophaga TaxID=160324 RepID=A0A9N9VQH7_9HYPO|nr:unnamed protein product [Clonostachys rhizophaga]
MSNPPGEETAKAALEYFFSQNPSDVEIQACVAFLAADISSESQGPEDHTSIHELIQRIALAKKAQAKVTKAKGNNPAATLLPLELNLAHLSYFVYAEKEGLENLIDESPKVIDARLRTVEPFLKMNPASGAADASYQPSVKRVKVGKGGNTIDRNRDAANEARQRDQHCIATGCPIFEACHIMPFSANNTSAKLETAREILTDIVMPMISRPDWRIVQKLVVPDNGEIGTSDEACNILCLNTLAHQLFDKAYFALEWIGLSDKGELDDEAYKTVRLRWHWLPNCVADALGQIHLHERATRKGDTGRLLKFGDGSDHGMATAIYRHLANASKISSHGVSLSRTENHRPLVTGNILLIRVREEDLDKTRVLIQIQWLALRMAAISGAAEVVDDLDSEPPGSLDELPTSTRAIMQAETDELHNVVLPMRRQMFAAQRAPESPDTEEAGPAPKAEDGRAEDGPAPKAEAELEATISPTLRDDSPPADDDKRPQD